MSHDDYLESLRIACKGYTFRALLFTMIRQADTFNRIKIKEAWPNEYNTFWERHEAPGGVLPRIDGFTVQEYADRLEQERKRQEEEDEREQSEAGACIDWVESD